MREVPPADECEAAVHDDDLPVVALLQVLDRRRAGDGAHQTQLHVRAGSEARQEWVRQAEGAVEAVQRVHDDAHRDAPRRRRGKRGLHPGADVVVHRHVDLEVDAPFGAREGVEEPAPRRRVVELDLDPVARDRQGARRSIEPRRERLRPGRRVEGERQRRGHFVRPEGGESPRAGRVKAPVDHGGDRESRAPHPGRDARQPDRIRLLGHVERRALVEHGARVGHALGKAERREPRAEERAAPDRAQAHGEEIGPSGVADPRETREILVRQLRVEEAERPMARMDDLNALFDGGDGVSARGLRGTGQAERLRAAGGDFRESVPAAGPRNRPSARHERNLLVWDRFEPPHAGGVGDPDAGRPAEIHGVGGVDRPPQRPRHGERREHEDGRPPRGDGEESSRKARHHEKVGCREAGGAGRRELDAGVNARDRKRHGEPGVGDVRSENRAPELGAPVIAEEGGDRSQGPRAERRARDLAHRSLGCGRVADPEKRKHQAPAQPGEKRNRACGEPRGDDEIDPGTFRENGERVGAKLLGEHQLRAARKARRHRAQPLERGRRVPVFGRVVRQQRDLAAGGVRHHDQPLGFGREPADRRGGGRRVAPELDDQEHSPVAHDTILAGIGTREKPVPDASRTYDSTRATAPSPAIS